MIKINLTIVTIQAHFTRNKVLMFFNFNPLFWSKHCHCDLFYPIKMWKKSKGVHIDKMPLCTIYCLKEEWTNYYKIGITKWLLSERLPSIQTWNPRRIDVYRTVQVREYYLKTMEKEIHMDMISRNHENSAPRVTYWERVYFEWDIKEKLDMYWRELMQ